VARFVGKAQSAIEKSKAEYAAFIAVNGEKVEASVDRLDCIMQRLTTLGQPPTAESKIERLKAGLIFFSLKLLVFNIAMLNDNTSYVDQCKQCRKYDDAAAGAMFDVVDKPEANYNDDNGDVVTCGYPQRRKKGHTQEFCRPKKRHQQMSAAKRKRNKSNDSKSDDLKSDDSRQIPG
jgi:hypothetical protein